MKVGIYEAKANFSRMIELAQNGEEIEVTKNGRIAAKIIGAKPSKRSLIGLWKNEFVVSDDFNDPLDDDETLMYLDGSRETRFFGDEDPN